MMFKKRVLMALVLVGIMVFFTGCNGQEISTAPNPYHGGNRGLDCTFEHVGFVSDTSGTNEVWSDESFPLSVECYNKGEFDLRAGVVRFTLAGIGKSDFSGLRFEMPNPNDLDRVSEFLPDGEMDIISFGDGKITYMAGNVYDANIYAYYEYPYRTEINVPHVCFKENIRDDSICEVDATKVAYNSGGPFEVGTVKEKYMGRGEIMLEIPIRNVQQGKSKALSGDEYRAEYDEIEFYVNDVNWECKSRGNTNIARITHPNGDRSSANEATIICTNKNLEEDALYTSSFNLVLEYFYKDNTATVVRFKKSPE